jgi:hypothetical protein
MAHTSNKSTYIIRNQSNYKLLNINVGLGIARKYYFFFNVLFDDFNVYCFIYSFLKIWLSSKLTDQPIDLKVKSFENKMKQ